MNESKEIPAEQAIADDIAVRAKRAVDSDRALFLLVYYEHEAVKLAFLKSLQVEVRNQRLTTQTFDPAQRPEHGKGLLYPLLQAASGEKILSLIASLPRLEEGRRLDPSFLEYLNLHRDQIARDKLRFVLFLHTSEADEFIEGAGDLWDFRHHTYWLERRPQVQYSGGQLPVPFSERSLSEIPHSDEEQAEIDNHVKNVSLLIDRTTDAEEKGQLYLDLSRWLTRRHLHGAAAEAAMTGLDVLPPTVTKQRANLEHELAFALNNLGNLSDALTHYQHSVRIASEIGDRTSEAATLNNISQIYDAWGRYDEALKKLEDSLAIQREIGDRYGEAVTLNNISQVYDAWGRYEEALKKLEESLVIRREIGDRSGEAVTLNNISVIYQAWGQNDEALKKLEESLAITREIGDRRGEAVTLNNISMIYRAWERHGEALEKLEESLAIRRVIGDRYGEAVTLNNISLIFHVWGRYDEALKKLEESLAIRREIGDRSGEAVTCWNLAVEFERRGDLSRATKYAQCTVSIDEETKHPDLEQDRRYLASLQERFSKEHLQ